MAGRAEHRHRGDHVADLLVRGATVVGASAIRPLDILIDNGRIAALVEPGAATATTEIDAHGLMALPGIVDAHVHFNEPGRTEWEGWASGSRAAAAGGVTTVCDMPLNSIPPTLDGASFDLKAGAAEGGAIVDFALWGGLTAADRRPLRELRERGAVGVKAFLCDSGVPEFPVLAPDTVADAFSAAAEEGLLVAVHAEDPDVVRDRTEAVLASGRRDIAAWRDARPVRAEVRGVASACDAAASTGARLHIVHVSSAEALGPVGLLRDRIDVTVETCPHYLVFDGDGLASAGALLKCAPPIRDAASQEELWRALLGGRIDYVASDHSPASIDLKRGTDMFAAWGGVSGVQYMLPALMTHALRRAEGTPGVEAVAGFIAWRLAAKPAQRLGLWPRKGQLAAGADADIAFIQVGGPFDAAPSLSRSGMTPYLARTFDVVVRRTMVRGRVVFDEGAFPADPGWGRLVRA